MKIRLLFAWYDLWIGVFWDRKTRRLYVLPLPCVGIVVEGMTRMNQEMNNATKLTSILRENARATMALAKTCGNDVADFLKKLAEQDLKRAEALERGDPDPIASHQKES